MSGTVDFDLGSLSASQQEALQQYTDVTSQEVKDAIPLLERSQWNVQVRFDSRPLSHRQR
jgi:FAS-associated factor 2